jgi:hypothetical protein
MFSSEQNARIQLVDFARTFARPKTEIALSCLAAFGVLGAAVVSASFAFTEVRTDLEKKNERSVCMLGQLEFCRR